MGWDDLVCVECFWDDWANGGCVDVLVWYRFTYREYGFSSIKTWSYSREWV